MRWLIIYILIFSFSGSKLNCQTIQETVNFSDQLFEEENYDLALQGYKRIAFFDSSKHWLNYYKKACCEWKLNQKSEALISLNQAFFLCEEEVGLEQIYFKKLNFLIQLKMFENALEEIQISNLNLLPKSLKRELFFSGVSYYGMERYGQSKIKFSQCLHPSDFKSHKILDSLFRDTTEFKSPNPSLAKSLSYIIPGAGQAYAGNGKDGFNSLIINVVFMGLFVHTA